MLAYVLDIGDAHLHPGATYHGHQGAERCVCGADVVSIFSIAAVESGDRRTASLRWWVPCCSLQPYHSMAVADEKEGSPTKDHAACTAHWGDAQWQYALIAVRTSRLKHLMHTVCRWW